MSSSARYLKLALQISATLALSVAAMGSGCPGTGSSANFDNPALVAVVPTVIEKQWQAPMFIDLAVIDETSSALDLDQNMRLTANENFLPPVLFYDKPHDYFAVFNRFNPDALHVNVFATQQPDFSSSGWVQGYQSFTQLDDNKSTFGGRYLYSVDSGYNSMVVFTENSTLGFVPMATRHIYGNGGWSTPAIISDTSLTSGASYFTVAMGTDSHDNTVVVWEQPNASSVHQAYFNEYRSSTGWRFRSGIPFATWNDPADTLVADNGMSLGFDKYGNGYAAYITGAAPSYTLRVARWRGDTLPNFSATTGPFSDIASIDVNFNCNANGLYCGNPKIWVRPDGGASVFYTNFAFNGGGHLSLTETGPNSTSAAGIFTVPRRFDLLMGDQRVNFNSASPTTSNPRGAVLSHRGYQGAVGYMKSDGTNIRFFVAQYVNGTWIALGPADFGGAGRDVYDAALAINSAGQIAVVYEANSPTDGDTHIYGNFWDGTIWVGVTQLDTFVNIVALGTTVALSGETGAEMLPVVQVGDDGTAMALFTRRDTLGKRRQIAITYQ
jgi:hypothetical protein